MNFVRRLGTLQQPERTDRAIHDHADSRPQFPAVAKPLENAGESGVDVEQQLADRIAVGWDRGLALG